VNIYVDVTLDKKVIDALNIFIFAGERGAENGAWKESVFY
jgi:hypothetical protein